MGQVAARVFLWQPVAFPVLSWYGTTVHVLRQYVFFRYTLSRDSHDGEKVEPNFLVIVVMNEGVFAISPGTMVRSLYHQAKFSITDD